MSGDQFEAVVRDEGSRPTIELHGTVDKAAKEGIEAAYQEAAAQPGEILLDFTDVDYINSTGIAVIVGVLAMARAAGRAIAGYGLTDHYREVFQITRLSDFMHIYADTPAAS